jgi:hypothetical protein
MKKILLLLFCVPLILFSQDHVIDDCGFACTHDNEFAIGIGVMPSHDFSLGFHAHYIKGVALHNKLGLGLGFETIFDEHTHNAYNLMFVYRAGTNINGYLSIAYGVGVLRSEEEDHHEEGVTSTFAQHLEFVWELNHKQRFCYGPVLDIGFEKGEVHYMIGLHIGRVF